MNGSKELTNIPTSRCFRRAMIILLALLIFCVAHNTWGRSTAPTKIAVIAIDPNLGDAKFYLNSPRIYDEIEWYKKNGYRLASQPGTIAGITQALLNPNVKAITFVGEGGTRRGDGTIAPTLAGLNAINWQRRIQRALEQLYQSTGVPRNEAMARAQSESQNFHLDRVVNYSCWSLVDTSIAEQFVAPGGMYYGSSVRYSGNPISFVYFWFTDKAQFLLEDYQLPLAPQRKRIVGPTPVPSSQFPPAKNLIQARQLLSVAERQTQRLISQYGPNHQSVINSRAEEGFYRREVQRLSRP